MAIQIGQQPLADFNSPVDMMEDCHRRIEHFLAVLVAVVDDALEVTGGEVNDCALTPDARKAVETALAYFDGAAPKHTADEEESLFPRMREVGGEAVQEALAVLDRLEADHVEAERLHAEVDEILHAWLQASLLPSEALGQARDVLVSLQGIYSRHIAVEDNEVFPLAREVLGEDQLQTIGAEMKQRRGNQSCRERKAGEA